MCGGPNSILRTGSDSSLCQELIFVKFGGGDKYQLCLCQELISLLCSFSFVMEHKNENQYRKLGQSATLCQELIGEIDQDGNGSISFNEFVWLMTRFVFVFVHVSLYLSFHTHDKVNTLQSGS